MSNSLKFLPRQDDIPTEDGSWYAGRSPLQLRELSGQNTELALNLRYAAYAALGIEADKAFKSFDARFDTAQSTLLLGAFDGERMVGSVRLCFTANSDVTAMPCAAVYPAVRTLAERHVSMVEVSRMSIDPNLTNTSYRTTLYAFLVRASLASALAAKVSMLLVATKPESVQFYKLMLGFLPIGEPSPYPPGDFKITLMGGSVQAALKMTRNRFFRVTAAEVASMTRMLARRKIT